MKNDLSVGQIAGIAVGVTSFLVFVLICIGVIVYMKQKRKNKTYALFRNVSDSDTENLKFITFYPVVFLKMHVGMTYPNFA